jgi:hypothetical protein
VRRDLTCGIEKLTRRRLGTWSGDARTSAAAAYPDL